MINKIRKVILLITTILFACHLQVAGKEFFVSEQSIPDFKFIFDKLSQNRITYNRYNDSIFSIHNHDEFGILGNAFNEMVRSNRRMLEKTVELKVREQEAELNALMAIPNLISLLLLSPLIVRLTREYFARREADAGATQKR